MNSKNLRFTAAICTYNRSQYLEPLIARLLSQKSNDRFDILLVDNSTEEADRYAALNLSNSTGITLMRSEPPGLSRARNLAIDACKTEVICFLDDDALPLGNWGEAISKPFGDPQVGFVAGPIEPLWPEEGKPDWLSEENQGCLSVLDMGTADRALKEHEYAYGANMAFRISAVRKTGGFDIALGRAGSSSLLSEEEIDIQDKLRELGYRGFYAAGAGVKHRIEKERLSRHWFISRIAWQGVSTTLRDSNKGQYNLLEKIQDLAEECGLPDLTTSLLKPTTAGEFDTRLKLIQLLVTYFLCSKSFGDLSNSALQKIYPDADLRIQGIDNTYHPSAPVPLGTKYLFFDSNPGHHYLYDLYGELGDSHFIAGNFDQWGDQRGRDINFLEKSLTESIEAIVFLTLDPYLFGPNFPYFQRMLNRQEKRRVYGILHKIPQDEKDLKRLSSVSSQLRVIVLDEVLQGLVQKNIETEDIFYLPHHAVLEKLLGEKHQARARRQLPEDKIIVSLLGELRDGKGINRLTKALPHFSPEIKQKVVFLIVGKATDVEPEELKEAFRSHSVASHVVAERGSEGYKLVPEPELADYVVASDIGLLLYENSQQYCASGILPNYVTKNIPVVASEDSVVGQFVKQYDLGWLADISSSEATARAITKAIESVTKKAFESQRAEYLRKEMSSDSVVKELQRILQNDVSLK